MSVAQERPTLSTPSPSVPIPSEISATLDPPDSFADPSAGLIVEPRGTPTPDIYLGARSNPVGQTVYGLTFGVTYPVISRDGGKSWKIDGPIFDTVGASGPDEADFIVATSASSVYAWGHGNLVRSTTDAGQHWWMTFFSMAIGKVTNSNGTLAATVSVGPSTTATYSSEDYGRTWTLNPFPR